MDACVEAELVHLRKIYRSLKDGMTDRKDWFTFGTEAPAGTQPAAGTAAAALNAKVQAKKPGVEAPAPEATAAQPGAPDSFTNFEKQQPDLLAQKPAAKAAAPKRTRKQAVEAVVAQASKMGVLTMLEDRCKESCGMPSKDATVEQLEALLSALVAEEAQARK
jgi:hypothetical protein